MSHEDKDLANFYFNELHELLEELGVKHIALNIDAMHHDFMEYVMGPDDYTELNG